MTVPILRARFALLPESDKPAPEIEDDDLGDVANAIVIPLVPAQVVTHGQPLDGYVIDAESPFQLVGKPQLLTFIVTDETSMLRPHKANIPLVVGPPQHLRITRTTDASTMSTNEMRIPFSAIMEPDEHIVEFLDAAMNQTKASQNMTVKLAAQGQVIATQKVK